MVETLNEEPTNALQQDSWRRKLPPALLLALLALALVSWQWLDTKRKLTRLEASLSQKLSEFDNRNRETALLAKQAETTSAVVAAQVAILQQKQAEFQSQQESLQTIYREFANNRDERAFAEVEQLLIIANQQLQLAGNVKTALLALQSADQRLQQMDKPQAVQLRAQLAKDIERLQASPAVDIAGISLKLETMANAATGLPLVSEHHPRPSIPASQQEEGWRGLAGEIWRDIRQLVRIERIDRPEPPLLTPEQAFFLRENLKIRLLTARIALLQHDEATYRADLRAAEAWLKRHFDIADPVVGSTITSLRELAGNAINIQLPDISESLATATRYKLMLQK